MATNQVRSSGLILYRLIRNTLYEVDSGDREYYFEFLLLESASGAHHWSPPKGKVKPGETIRQAAIRETEEEAGLPPCSYKFAEWYTFHVEYIADDKPKRVDYVAAEMIYSNSPICLSQEHRDYMWGDVPQTVVRVHPTMRFHIMKLHKLLNETYNGDF